MIQRIGDWYAKNQHSYIRIYENSDLPHLCPMFVPNRLLLREIGYQTSVKGIEASLSAIFKRD